MGVLRARVGGQWVDIGVDVGVPFGTILPFGGTAAPGGYLLCNGAAVSRTTYANLFAAIGTTWGVGDGSTTFNVPDLMGRAPIGAGSGAGLTARTAGTKVGAETHLLTSSESGLVAHTHPLSDPGFVVGVGNGALPAGGNGYYRRDVSTVLTVGASSAFNANSAHNNMQPSAVVTYIVRAS